MSLIEECKEVFRPNPVSEGNEWWQEYGEEVRSRMLYYSSNGRRAVIFERIPRPPESVMENELKGFVFIHKRSMTTWGLTWW